MVRPAVRNRRLLRSGLAVLALALCSARWPGRVTVTALVSPAPGSPLAGGQCGAFPGAHQLPGAGGVVPAAWSGGGLLVPACGPVPGDGTAAARVYPYPDALWTAGYQCVEFSERYLYDRFGVTMNIPTDGDQVAAHYGAGYAGLFMVIRNGTPHRAPAAGDVLALSAAPGFDSASGGHTAVVQSSSVSAAGNGTVTVVEENANAAGVAVLQVSDWTVRFPGFGFVEWLTTAGLTVTSPHPPRAVPGKRYSFALTATDGRPPYRWRVTSGTLPAGLALSAAGVLSGAARAGPAAAPPAGRWPVTVTVTDTRGATATAALSLSVAESPAAGVNRNLKYAEWAWRYPNDDGW
jgi:Putative Ig domain/CHAP domain